MSGDETAVLLLSGVIAGILWIRWYWRTARVPAMLSSAGDRAALYLTPPLCLIILFGVLKTLAAHDVRDDPRYIALYLMMGAAWVGIAGSFLPMMGLAPRDDVVERRNPAASIAIAGALLGVLLCFSGGNIGDGPGWWVVVFCAMLATAIWLVLWLLLEWFTRRADAITIDRDPAAGVRLGAALSAFGLILGRSVAGDWHTAAQTVSDCIVNGWPVLVLLVVTIIVERMTRHTADAPGRALIADLRIPLAEFEDGSETDLAERLRREGRTAPHRAHCGCPNHAT